MSRLTFTDASDHLVSEAIYFNDPEGNGIEVYADRPCEAWVWSGSRWRAAMDAESGLAWCGRGSGAHPDASF
jgi:catechol-2,3-dioxygenase